MTLLDLSNQLETMHTFGDMFDFQIDGEILDIESMTGSFADKGGDIVVEFDILELDREDDFMYTTVQLTSHKDLNQIAYESCRQAGEEC